MVTSTHVYVHIWACTEQKYTRAAEWSVFFVHNFWPSFGSSWPSFGPLLASYSSSVSLDPPESSSDLAKTKFGQQNQPTSCKPGACGIKPFNYCEVTWQ